MALYFQLSESLGWEISKEDLMGKQHSDKNTEFKGNFDEFSEFIMIGVLFPPTTNLAS